MPLSLIFKSSTVHTLKCYDFFRVIKSDEEFLLYFYDEAAAKDALVMPYPQRSAPEAL
jgi:hypothetical protein